MRTIHLIGLVAGLALLAAGCKPATINEDDDDAVDDDAGSDDDTATDDDGADDDGADDDDSSPPPPIIADHDAAADFEQIPSNLFEQIRNDYTFFYGHTSHGSQIMSGIAILEDEDGTQYARPGFTEISDDLGASGDTSWVQPTEDHLDTHPDTNVAMWSWCGGVSTNTEEGIDTYLAAMEQLEADYPNVLFIYMTGHLASSSSETANTHERNAQIREYCLQHDKVLFDFEDIEMWDPDGTQYPDDTDACNWCSAWCDSHECPGCDSCSHSHCFNCYLKGRAFWWMMARVAGWDGA